MSTPNEPQDPYSSPQDPYAAGSPQPSTPQYGQYAPQDPAAGQAPQYGQYGQDPSGAPQYGQPGAAQYGQPAPYPTYQGQQYGGPVYGYPKNGLAVWSLVLSIVGLVLCGLFTGIPAVIVGVNARKAVARGEASNGGMATAGIIIGALAIAWSIFGVLVFVLGGGIEAFQEGWNQGSSF